MIVERRFVARLFDVVAIHKPQFTLSGDWIALLYLSGLLAAVKYRLGPQRAKSRTGSQRRRWRAARELCLARGRGALQRVDCDDVAGWRRFAAVSKLETAVVCRMARLGNFAVVLQLLMRAHEQEQTTARCQLG